MMRLLLTICVTILVILLGACSSHLARNANKNVKASHEYQPIITKAHSVLIISDACFFGADDEVEFQTSEQAQTQMLISAKDYFDNKGYITKTTQKQSICAGVKTDEKLPIKKTVNGEENTVLSLLPVYLNAASAIDQYQTRLSDIVYSTAEATILAEEQRRKENQAINNNFNEDRIDYRGTGNRSAAQSAKSSEISAIGSFVNQNIIALQNESPSDLVLVLLGRGQEVSMAKSFGLAMLTGLLSTSLSGSGQGLMLSQVSTFGEMAALFEAKTGQLIWTNWVSYGDSNMALDEKYLYRRHLSRYLFFDIPAKQTTVNTKDGLNYSEIRSILAGNTVSGTVSNSDVKFVAYFDQSGVIYSDGHDDQKLEGYWRINDNNELCLEFDELLCDAFEPLDNGQYKTIRNGMVTSVFEKIENGDIVGWAY